MNITEFLLARIAEDEAFWRSPAGQFARECQECAVLSDYMGEPESLPNLTVDRMLAECEAKRRIVEMAAGSADFNQGVLARYDYRPYLSPSRDVLTRVQQLLALPYVDHPDYRAEWRP